MIRKSIIQKSIFCLLALLLSMRFSSANELDIAKKKINATSLDLIKDTVGYKVYSAGNHGFCIVKDTCVVAYSKSDYISTHSIGSVLFPPKKKTLVPKHIYDTIKPLLCDIKYNQYSPFNDELPLYNEEKCVTGCVPVAVAQVMKYYNYPPYTIADIPSFETKTAKLTMGGIPKLTRFDWQNIAPYYQSKTSKEKKEAVAHLMKIVCSACYTDLQVDGSPTEFNNAFRALVDYFGYDRSKIHVITSTHFPVPQFEELLYKELSNNRPVILANNSHAFICDGYENGLFHVNWGWEGQLNGYFDMSLLAAEVDSCRSAFVNDAMSATLGVVPNICETNVPITNNLWVSSLEDPVFSPTLSSSGEIKGSLLCTVHSNTFKEILSHVNVGYSDGNGKWIVMGDDDFIYKGSYGYGHGSSIHVNCKLKDNASYRIFPLEKCEGKDWEPMENSCYHYLDIVIENGKISVFQPKEYSVKANVSFTELQDGKFVKLDLSNSGYRDFCDTFYVKLNNFDECLAKQQLIIPANGDTSVLYKYADSTTVSKNVIKVFDSKHTLLAETTFEADNVKEKIDDSIAQEISQNSAETTEVSAPKDPETISSTLIALGVILAFLLIIFIKIFS